MDAIDSAIAIRMKAEGDAYNEIEALGLAALLEHSADRFADLPASVRSSLLTAQMQIFAKHGVSKEDYNTDLDFIGVD
jgi:hypothetical protein